MSGYSRFGDVPPRRRLPAWALPFVLVVLTGCAAARTSTVYTPRHDSDRIQTLVNELRGRVAIDEDVAVMIVPSNPLLVSAESSSDRPGAFLLRLDENFLDGLTAGELEAVLAHELGHVWIFTHHPYLQTEALANRVALRVVTRESLVGVYEKVWKHSGAKGDLAGFLGLSASAETSPPAALARLPIE